MDDELRPWERQPGETAKAFEAFAYYRDMPRRSLTRMVQAGVKSRTLLSKWSAVHQWVDRVSLYDAWRDRERIKAEQEEEREAIRAMKQRQAVIGAAMQIKVAKRLEKLKPEQLSPKECALFLQVGAKIERESRGVPGEIVEARTTETSGIDSDTVQRILADPEAAELALRLTERLANAG